MRDVDDTRVNYGVSCSCSRLPEPHGIQRKLCMFCIKIVRKRAENTGDTGMNIVNEIEKTKTHGQVVWG